MRVYGYWTLGGGFTVARADPAEDSAPLITVEFHNEAAGMTNEAKTAAMSGVTGMMYEAIDAAREAEGEE